jgi:hypothetical protein
MSVSKNIVSSPATTVAVSFSERNYQRSPTVQGGKQGVQRKFPAAPVHITTHGTGRGFTVARFHNALSSAQQSVSELTTH